MLIESEEQVLARVFELLSQLDSRRLARVRRHAAMLWRRRTIDTVSKAGMDVEAGLLAVADRAATLRDLRAQLGLAEIAQGRRAIIVEGDPAERDDDDDDELLEPTVLADVQPYRAEAHPESAGPVS